MVEDLVDSDRLGTIVDKLLGVTTAEGTETTLEEDSSGLEGTSVGTETTGELESDVLVEDSLEENPSGLEGTLVGTDITGELDSDVLVEDSLATVTTSGLVV